MVIKIAVRYISRPPQKPAGRANAFKRKETGGTIFAKSKMTPPNKLDAPGSPLAYGTHSKKHPISEKITGDKLRRLM
jgi:hypothetical protein